VTKILKGDGIVLIGREIHSIPTWLPYAREVVGIAVIDLVETAARFCLGVSGTGVAFPHKRPLGLALPLGGGLSALLAVGT